MNSTARDFDNKVVIITGAQQGIGLETAKHFCANGARVVMADLPGSVIAESAAQVASLGEVRHCHVDIASEQSVKSLVEFTLDHFGRLDILDNNAARQGLAQDDKVLDMDPDVWDSVFAVNTRGTMLMCKHGIKAMLATGGGSIVNISSGTSLAGQVYQTAYACSKAAVNALTMYVATQYGKQGIRCNAIALGLVMTEALARGMPEDFQQLYIDNKLVPRLGKPKDIAEMVGFLSSDRAQWITGQVYSVDGGFFAHGPQMAGELELMAQTGEHVGS
jgi:NAD(P)-dependent dehydrogenase (short-subunit alcohol dehydrogenase family)